MRVPGILYGTDALVRDMDEKVYQQVVNVATLPGIVRAAYAMPDAHWGYGFPIGGVAAFDADLGGVVSAGGVGFDISCGVRLLSTGLHVDDIEPVKKRLADELSRSVPAGVGSIGRVHLDDPEMNAMLAGGARWAVDRGYGTAADLDRIEEHGCMSGARPEAVSDHAKRRQCDEMGTLGSGNHYLTELVRRAFARLLPRAALTLLYDVSHNTCKVELHEVDGRQRRLFVHRKGATRAFGPGHPDLPQAFAAVAHGLDRMEHLP
ncbi:MAG: RtcB family protein [Acidobacteria bacterium]|nr:RtcB family protein [Acidobacteriota bacterium]